MTAPCPACHEPMHTEPYEGHYGRLVDLDVCHRCNALWFDRLEHLALSAGAVLELIRSMHTRRAPPEGAMPEALRCPRCSGPLRRALRTQRTVRYEVHECSAGHGHFITFYQLLRERECVRPLSGEKLRELRRQVSSVACSNCGAPVDLHRTTACGHCGAPLALLDPEALTSTLERLDESAQRRARPDPARIAEQLLEARLVTERNFHKLNRIAPGDERLWDGRPGLLELAYEAVTRLTRPR